MITKHHLKRYFGSTEKVAEFFDVTIQAVGTWKKGLPELRLYQLRDRKPHAYRSILRSAQKLSDGK